MVRKTSRWNQFVHPSRTLRAKGRSVRTFPVRRGFHADLPSIKAVSEARIGRIAELLGLNIISQIAGQIGLGSPGKATAGCAILVYLRILPQRVWKGQ